VARLAEFANKKLRELDEVEKGGALGAAE